MISGEPHVAMKPIVEGVGLSWRGQAERLQRDPVLSEGARVIRTPSAGGSQRTTMLPRRSLPTFFQGIDAKRMDG